MGFGLAFPGFESRVRIVKELGLGGEAVSRGLEQSPVSEAEVDEVACCLGHGTEGRWRLSPPHGAGHRYPDELGFVFVSWE